VVSEIHEVDNLGIHHAGRGSAIPAWLKMPTDRAARQIVKAIYKKKREQVITFHGKILVQLKRHFPGLMDWVLRTLSKKLPKTRVEK
jgi:short-subunit dehydrogenase